MPINKQTKKTLKRAALMGLSGVKLGFSIGAGLTKASLDTANDMAGYFTDVKLPNRVGDWLECGVSKAGNALYKQIKKSVMRW